MKSRVWSSGRFLAALCCGVAFVASAAPNIRLSGTLVAEPCTVVSPVIEVDFGTIVDKYLYKNTRTLGQSFVIELGECDLSLGNSVFVTFAGTESLALPGLLAVGTESSGIAIGIETFEGRAVKLNQRSDRLALQSPDTLLVFNAYVQGEPMAITNHRINRGGFTAITTFKLDYP